MKRSRLVAVGALVAVLGLPATIALAAADDGWLNTEDGSGADFAAHCVHTPDHDDFTFSGDGVIRVEMFFKQDAWSANQWLGGIWDNSGDGPYAIYYDGSSMNALARYSGGNHAGAWTVAPSADWWWFAVEFDQVGGEIRQYSGGTDPDSPSWVLEETDSFAAYTMDAPSVTGLTVGGFDQCSSSSGAEIGQYSIQSDYGGTPADVVRLDFGDPAQWPDQGPNTDGTGKTFTLYNSATVTVATTTTTTTTTTTLPGPGMPSLPDLSEGVPIAVVECSTSSDSMACRVGVESDVFMWLVIFSAVVIFTAGWMLAREVLR